MVTTRTGGAPAQAVAQAAADPASDTQQPSTSGGGESSRVIYLGHLPHGFYEKQLRGFFSQFGDVTRLRVSRNKKTGKAKHYAFVEFKTPEVAKIAAEAMDGYMMFSQRLACRVMLTTEVHPELFKNAKRPFKLKPWKQLEINRREGARTAAQEAARVDRAVKRDAKRQQRIRAAGLEYEYTGLQALVPPKAQHTKFDEA